MAITDKFKQLRSSHTVKKTFIGALIALVIFSLVGFFLVPPILKSVLIKKLSEGLYRQVAIRQVKVNPFMLSVTLKGFLINEKNGRDTFVSFDELYLNLQSISIYKRGVIFSEIKVNKPYMNIVLNEDGSYNFSDLLESKPKKEGKKPRFSLNNIQILNGSIDFLDGLKHTAHKLRDMDINIPFISNLPYYADRYVQPSFEAKINETPVSFKGKTKPFKDSLETHLGINIKDLEIPFYMAYSPFKLSFKVPSGFLDVNTEFSFIQYRNRPPSLNVSGNVAIKKIKVVDLKEEPIISLHSLEISFAPSDLIAKRIHLAKVAIDSPEIHMVRDKTGTVNLQSLVPEKGYVLKRKEESPVLSADIDEVRLTGGKISIVDFSHQETFRTNLENIDLKVDHFSNGKDRKSGMSLSLDTESKESVRVTGEFSVVPLASEGIAELGHIQLKKYSPYYSQSVLFDVREGALDLSTKYKFQKTEKEPEIRLVELSADLTSLKLRKRGEKDAFLDIPLVSLKNTSVDLTKKEVNIGAVSTQKGLLKIRRYSDGKLNIQNLVPESGTSGGNPGKSKKGQEMLVTLKDISVDRYTVKVEDSVPQKPVNLVAERINFKGTNLSTAKNSKGRASLSFMFNKKGSVTTNGSVSMNPLSANMKLNVKGLEIAPFQSYFTDQVKIIITQGDIALNGTFSSGYSKDSGMKASYKGEASVQNFTSLDKANAEEFLKWKSLYFGGMDTTYNPLYVNIAQVALTDFYSRIIINKDGSINLQQIMQEKAGGEIQKTSETPQGKPVDIAAKPPAVGPAQKSSKLIKIDTVTFQGGTINFSDNHIQPHYSSNFFEIGGKVSGLSSEENKFADVDLRGKLENYAPLEITGKINPLRDDLFVDLKIDFKNMDLSPVTPYSGRFLGYTIQKGVLSMNLQYMIVKKKLDSQNNILLDQFTLGDKVESPNATKLPVKLAIALLKNRKGEIDLNLPVSGYIDDPKFSMGRIIIKILVNLLTKAATSPFALIGAIFGGGGEELSYVEFDFGSSNVAAQDVKKLDTLVKALFDRPALKLEIEGHVDVERDREGLKQYLFENKVKAQKLKDLVKKGQPAIPVDKVTIEKEEYEKYLKMAYKAEKFPKPRTFLGFTKNLPVPEMEKLMLTHIEVKGDDLRQLTSHRALTIKDYLLESGKVTADRIFLVEPKSLAPEKKEKLKDSRVDFRLK